MIFEFSGLRKKWKNRKPDFGNGLRFFGFSLSGKKKCNKFFFFLFKKKFPFFLILFVKGISDKVFRVVNDDAANMRKAFSLDAQTGAEANNADDDSEDEEIDSESSSLSGSDSEEDDE